MITDFWLLFSDPRIILIIFIAFILIHRLDTVDVDLKG